MQENSNKNNTLNSKGIEAIVHEIEKEIEDNRSPYNESINQYVDDYKKIGQFKKSVINFNTANFVAHAKNFNIMEHFITLVSHLNEKIKKIIIGIILLLLCIGVAHYFIHHRNKLMMSSDLFDTNNNSVIYEMKLKIDALEKELNDLKANTITQTHNDNSVISKLLPETKSFEFRADRRDYVDNQKAMIWCNENAQKIKDILKQHPNTKFLIKGYVAEFENEIDGDNLAKERVENIKKELIKRQVPESALEVDIGGRTTRWGNERSENRAVTIESMD